MTTIKLKRGTPADPHAPLLAAGEPAVDFTPTPPKLYVGNAAASANLCLTPTPQTAAGAGQFNNVSTASGAGWTLPSGGTWAYWGIQVLVSGGTLAASYGGIAAGGTLIVAGTSGRQVRGWEWRIA